MKTLGVVEDTDTVIQIAWYKVPSSSVPGFGSCSVPVTEDGRMFGDHGELIEDRPRWCGKPTVWCAGRFQFCQEHFAWIAHEWDNGPEALEQEWNEMVLA